MKRIAATAAAAALVAGPAFALVDFAGTDLNNDEFLTLPEILAVYPNFDPVDFYEIDTDNNRLVDFAEANTGGATAIFDGQERVEGNLMGSAFDMTDYDADADSALTYDEVAARNPNVPEEYFDDFDLDNSGTLDAEELNSSAFQNLLNRYES